MSLKDSEKPGIFCHVNRISSFPLQSAARIALIPSVVLRLNHLLSTPNMSVTPMAYSTANWHWKNKTVTPWAKEWFERELVTIQVEGSDGAIVSVERVVSVDGDVELGRRKSKYVRTLLSSVISDIPSRCHAWSEQSRGRPFFITFVKNRRH